MKQYLPFIKMKNNGYSGLKKWYDNATLCTGILYPDSSFTSQINNSTNLGNARDFITNMGSTGISGATADTSPLLAQNALMKLYAPQYFQKYASLVYAKISALTKGVQDSSAAEDSIAANYPGLLCTIELDSTRQIVVYIKNSNQTYGIVVTRDATTKALTWGIPTQIYGSNPNNPYHQDVSGVLLNTNKALVLIGGANSLYCLSVTGTGSSATFTVTTQGSVVSGPSGSIARSKLLRLDTDKAMIIETNSSSSNGVYARVVTYSGTTATLGTGVQVSNNAGNATGDVLSPTKVFYAYTFATGAQGYGAVLTISGTTITVSGVATIGTGNPSQVGNWKHCCTALSSTTAMLLSENGDNGSAAVKIAWHITVSGTTFTAVSNTLTNAFNNVGSSGKYGSVVPIVAGSSYLFLETNGSQNWLRIFNISGTTITESNYTLVTIGTGSGSAYTSSHALLALWGTDIAWFATCRDSGSALYVWQGPAGATTVEIYNSATLLGSAVTLSTPFIESTVQLNAILGGKDAYIGLKNTTASDRAINLAEIMFEVV